MTLTREVARQQAARLQSSPMLAPQSGIGRSEIVDCLLRHCQDAQHCSDVMTTLLDAIVDPKNVTAEIAAIAGRTRRADQAPPGCERCCAGEDVATGAMTWLPFVHVKIKGYSCGRRCSCARGRWLAEGDRARALQEAEATRPREFVAARQVIDSKIVGVSERQ